MRHRQKIRNGLILISFFFFPAVFFYFSPVLIIEASGEGIINGSFIIFTLLLLSALVLGRGFCGWVCPAAGCQEALFSAQNKKVVSGNLLKWIIWVPWLTSIVILALYSGGYRRVDFFYQTTSGFSVGTVKGVIIYYVVLMLLIVIPALAIGKRSFCHHLCWMAPFMIIGRKTANLIAIPSLRLRVETQRCIECKRCSAQCPMSLPVQDMALAGTMENSECILCGTCIDVCKTRTIKFGFGAADTTGNKS